MPERLSHDPAQHDDEQPELQRQFEERIARVRHNMGQLYNLAIAESRGLLDDVARGRSVAGHLGECVTYQLVV